jgi:hypothetical protein
MFGIRSKLMISLALRELAEKAQKIGTLNITPDPLERLTKQDPEGEAQGE